MSEAIKLTGKLTIDDTKVLVLNPEQMAAAAPIEFTCTFGASRDMFSGEVRIEQHIIWPGRVPGENKLPEWKWRALIAALRKAAEDIETTIAPTPS